MPVSPNPTIKSTPLRAYPGWTVREYANGMFDVFHVDGALSPGYESFAECVTHARLESHPVFAALSSEARAGIAARAPKVPALSVRWLGPGHYRSDLHGVYDGNVADRDNPPQLFRGTRDECVAYIDVFAQLLNARSDLRWLRDHPYAGDPGDGDRVCSLIDELESQLADLSSVVRDPQAWRQVAAAGRRFA